MSCELYNVLTDNSIIAGTGPSCKHEKGCPQVATQCKWGPMLRNIARNMAILDTAEDLEHDAIVAELEAKKGFETEVRNIKEEGQSNALISISRVN